MNQNSSPVWPRRVPVFRLAGLALSIVLGVLLLRAWIAWSATPLQRFYFPTYSRLSLFSGLTLPMRSREIPAFRVVFVGRSMATDASLENAPGAVSIHQITANPNGFRDWLQTNIYAKNTLARLLRWPLIGFGICFVSLVVAGAQLDRGYDAKAREGRIRRGPSLTSRWRFNHQAKGDGLRLQLANYRNLLEWLMPAIPGKT